MSDEFDVPSTSNSGSGSASSSSGSTSKTPAKGDKGKFRERLKDAGQKFNERSVDDLKDLARDAADRITSFKRGGTKRGKGVARLHYREKILSPKMKAKRKSGRMAGRV